MRKSPKNPVRVSNKKISKEHPEFELTYAMMLGIRTTVGRGHMRQRLTSSHFTESTKLTFPHKGSRTTPSHEIHSFKFKDYAPQVFASIRANCGIGTADYQLCVCGNFNYLEFISNSKSGQFFFYTHDSQYMIKTVSRGEVRLLRLILSKYHAHLRDNPKSLLTKFYGMHRVTRRNRKQVHFLIMGSILHTSRHLHQTFDLKGSQYGRAAKIKDGQITPVVYKDNDLRDLGVKMVVGTRQAVELKRQLMADVKFLASLHIMDYSLLLGIHDSGETPPLASPAMRTPHALRERRSLSSDDDVAVRLVLEERLAVTDHSKGANEVSGGASGVRVSTGAVARGNSSCKQGNSERDVHKKLFANFPNRLSEPRRWSGSANGRRAVLEHGGPSGDSVAAADEGARDLGVKGIGGSSGDGSASLKEQHGAHSVRRSPRASPGRTRSSFVPPTPLSIANITTPSSYQRSKTTGSLGTIRNTSVKARPTLYNRVSRPVESNFQVRQFDLDLSTSPSNAQSEIDADDGGIQSVDSEGLPGTQFYYVGIIDILTQYGVKKTWESRYKQLRTSKDSLSCVRPNRYARRFLTFMDEIIK